MKFIKNLTIKLNFEKKKDVNSYNQINK